MRKKKKRKNIFKYLLYFIPLIVIISAFVYFKYEYKKVKYIEDRVEKVSLAQKNDTEDMKTIGWIRVQGTVIDMPVVYIENEKYKDDPTKSFAWNNTNDEHIRKKVDLLGHNILNLSSNPYVNQDNFTRFEDLMSFVYYDFAQKNQYVEYTIDGENYLYKIFGVRLLENYDGLNTVNDYNYTNEDALNYIDTVKLKSLYKYKVDVTRDDNYISLITCTRFYGPYKHGAMIVDARMVRKGEPTKNYPVEKTDNYKKILKYMKGDEGNV